MPRFRLRLLARWGTCAWLIFGIALVVRIPLIWGWMHDPRLDQMFAEPAAIARALLLGRGYSSAFPGASVPTAWFAPAFTFFLVPLFKYFSVLTSARIVLTLNLLFSCATAVAILLVGEKLVGVRPAALAAWIWVFWYYCAAFPLLLDDTSLCALLSLLGIWGLLEVERSRNRLQWAVSGIFWAFCCLVRPVFFSILAVYWIYLWINSLREFVVWRRGIAISIVAFAVIMTPWIARNYLAFGTFIFVRSDLPAEMYYANHEGLTFAAADYATFPGTDPTDYQRLGEPAYMARQKALVLSFIRKHPGEFVRLSATRALSFWSMPSGVGMWLFSLGAFLGLGLAIRDLRSRALPLAIPMIFFPLVYYLVYSFPRHRHPIDPVIALLFAYSLDWLLSQLRFHESPYASRDVVS